MKSQPFSTKNYYTACNHSSYSVKEKNEKLAAWMKTVFWKECHNYKIYTLLKLQSFNKKKIAKHTLKFCQ